MVTLSKLSLCFSGCVAVAAAFAPSRHRHHPPLGVTTAAARQHFALYFSKADVNDDDDDDDESKNPYQDENYPDLEFVDYSDPEYVVDQGVSDEFYFDPDDTEEQIEAMREERRRRNDEFQFESYFKNVLRNGKEYMGEWTVYRTSTFLPESSSSLSEEDETDFPRFHKVKRNLKVISRGYKVIVDPDAEWRVDGEVIRHEETVVPLSDSDAYKSSEDNDTDKEGLARPPTLGKENSPMQELEKLRAEASKVQDEVMSSTYWPEAMNSFDFRGQQGNMCVGNGYTICTAVPLLVGEREGSTNEGPFSELRTELGIHSDQVRFRIKLDYSVKDHTTEQAHPPLHLKSMIVCRETEDAWPRDGKTQSLENRVQADALFGAPGAPGGLYDPPPVGTEEQAACYMLLDLEGGATALFPHVMHQDPESFDGNGWVTSLDWTPGAIRYQVDRKVLGGTKLLGLRTLELSEVRGVDAEQYRPRDGGKDMRQ